VNRLPTAGDVLTMTRGRRELTVGRRLQEGGQGVVHEVAVGDGTFALKWLRTSPRTDALRSSIGALTERGSPHPAFVWPIDVVESAELEGFGYVMRLLAPRFVSFSRMLDEQPSFRTIVTVARVLVDAFAALHASGLCYRDISFSNLYVDPIRTEVAIIDNDNVGLDGGEAFVKGTNQFMAPEVVRDEALPSTATDLYSLAVFLFILFVRGHPLEGRRAIGAYSWQHGEHVSEDDLFARIYGADPLFVFDPDNDANRPPEDSPMPVYWPIYPRFFRDLFVRSFTEGLRDASLTGRVTGSGWRRGLARLGDLHAICACHAALFFDPEEPTRRCWRCGEVPPVPPLLVLPGRTVVLAEGTVIGAEHLRRDGDGQVAVVEPHPGEPGRVVLRNLSGEPWTVEPEHEGPKTVEPSQRLGVRSMRIDFGPVAARIEAE